MTNADVIWRLIEKIQELETQLEELSKAKEQKEGKD